MPNRNDPDISEYEDPRIAEAEWARDYPETLEPVFIPPGELGFRGTYCEWCHRPLTTAELLNLCEDCSAQYADDDLRNEP